MVRAEQGLKALTDHGLITVPFANISDLTVPKVDRTQAVLDDSFYPPSEPSAVVGRLETLDGAVLTYHCGMTLLGVTKAVSPTNYLLVQPSWSLCPILVPVDFLWRQSFRSAREVPLSLLPATALSEKVGVHRWPWRQNVNVEGGQLACGGIAVDLGVGTHTCCEIAFELPPQAKDFTTLVGIDQRIGPGACAIAQSIRTRRPIGPYSPAVCSVAGRNQPPWARCRLLIAGSWCWRRSGPAKTALATRIRWTSAAMSIG